MAHQTAICPARAPTPSSWIKMGSGRPVSVPIDWEALRKYAVIEKQKANTNKNIDITCELSAACKEGGLHIVRRLEFSDEDSWVARVQKMPPSTDTSTKLLHEVCTIQVIQERSNVPVPRVIAYCSAENNPVGAAFTIQQFIPADTAMVVLGERFSNKDQMPAGWEERYFGEMARIQAEIASVRFPLIGSITKTNSDYEVGPIPGIGGPFKTSATFFAAWASVAAFPFLKETAREWAPPELFEKVWNSVVGFPSHVAKLAESHVFREGPFPVFHPDLYRSNILMDHNCDVKAVIDWEGSMVVPWELVEFIKDLVTVPAALDGPLHQGRSSDREIRNKREAYVGYVREMERKNSFDSTLSTVLDDPMIQDFANAFWFWQGGKVGFYTNIKMKE